MVLRNVYRQTRFSTTPVTNRLEEAPTRQTAPIDLEVDEENPIAVIIREGN